MSSPYKISHPFNKHQTASQGILKTISVLLLVSCLALMHSKNDIRGVLNSNAIEQRVELTHRELDDLCSHNNCSSSNGFIHPYSGCIIADIVYAGSTDCRERYGNKLPYVYSSNEIPTGTVLYVGLDAMPSFEVFLLPSLQADIILITGSLRFGPHDYIQQYEAAQRVLAHPRIKLWMTQNPFVTHPKLHGFPYGLRFEDGVETVYKIVYDTLPQRTNQSREFLFHSYFSVESNREARENIPNGKKLLFREYLEQMTRHQYVLSPSGKKLDCYRNYEAIGLGTIPIVQTEEERFSWMQGAAFGIPSELWNNTEALKERLLPHVNTTRREFVLLDYWRLRVKTLKEKVFSRPADDATGLRVKKKF